MSDTNAPAGDTGDQTNSTSTTDTGGEETKDWKAEADKWRDLARKHEERSKLNAKAATELEELKKQSMSELEKAIAKAKDEGRTEGLSAGMSRLAAAEIKAAAAGRMTAEQLQALLEVTNLAVFVGEDGDIDQDKVKRFVDGIAPMPEENERETRQGFPDLGQGARGGSSTALNGDPLLRDLKNKLGIK